MKQENLDRILATEEPIVPSSGFVASVMERVRDQAAAPQPIPFPWKRIVPAWLLIVAVIGWCAVELARRGLPEMQITASLAPHFPAGLTQSITEAGWVAMALGVSLLSWMLSRRLIGRSGLM